MAMETGFITKLGIDYIVLVAEVKFKISICEPEIKCKMQYCFSLITLGWVGLAMSSYQKIWCIFLLLVFQVQYSKDSAS